MRHFAAAALFVSLFALSATSPAVAQSRRRARVRLIKPPVGSRLASRLTKLLDDPPFDRALWGVAIANPSGRIVFERNGDRLFVPASNMKLVVAAVAVALLPPDFRYVTSVYSAGSFVDSVITGNLVLYGRGDPTLSDRYYPTRFTPFEQLADSLKARGVTRIVGDIVADASYFDSTTIHPSWESRELTWWYAAPVTALGFNDNSVDLNITPFLHRLPPSIVVEPDLGMVQVTNLARTVPVDSPRTIDFHRRPGTNAIWVDGGVPIDARPWTENVAVADGPLWTGTAFRHALITRGITVTGGVVTTYAPTRWAAARARQPLAELRSPPLPQILAPILTLSHNWYAEMLLKTLGRVRTGVGSWDSGLAVERRFLIDSLGIDSTEFNLVDGSGLSHWNLMTPRAMVELLYAMYVHPNGEALREALPVGGTTGTLRYRYRDNVALGLVRAKTGSIANVNTLSGYLETPRGAWTFSIQLNNHTVPGRDALRRIDAIVAELGR